MRGSRGNSGYPNVMWHNTQKLESAEDICEGFNRYFFSVYNSSTTVNVNDYIQPPRGDTGYVHTAVFHQETVLKYIKKT